MNLEELQRNPGCLGSPNVHGSQLVLSCPECGCPQNSWKRAEPSVKTCLFCECKYLCSVTVVTKHGIEWRKKQRKQQRVNKKEANG